MTTRRRAISFNRVVLGLFAAALLITSGLLFSISYIGTLSIADREVERYARSAGALVRLVFEQQLNELDTFLRDLAADDRLRIAVESDDVAEALSILDRATLRRIGSQFEVLLIDRTGAPAWADASYSIFDERTTLPHEVRDQLADGVWQFHTQQGDRNATLVAAIALPVIRAADGRALGRLVGGYVLNGNLALMADLRRALHADGVALVHRGQTIAGMSEANADPPGADVISEFGQADHVTRDGRLFVRSSLSLASPAMEETVILSERPSETLKNVQRTYRDLSFPFLLYIIAASILAAFALHRVTTPALNRLVAYAQRIRHDTSDITYDPGRVREFNALGSALQDAFTELRDTDAQFRALIDGSLQGVTIHVDQRILYVNDALLQILGFDKTDRSRVIGMSVIGLFAPEEHDRLESYTKARDSGAGSPDVYEARAIGKDGRRVWVEVHVRRTRWNGADAVHVTLSDISERKRQEELIIRQANFDSLTGLPNRYLFRDRLAQALARAEWEGRQGAVFFLDLDRFKNINDTLGHGAGDDLIAISATRISAQVRDGGTVARLGGDEFAVILPNAATLLAIEETALRILEALSRPVVVGGGTEIFSSASIGITVFPADGSDVDMLLRQADTAMYHAKAEGGNAARFFSARMNEQAARAMETEIALRRALERRELFLNYQPVVNLSDNTIAGCEALVRWNDPVRGPVPPSDFIPVAEATGLIVPLGAFVLEEACRFLQDCTRAGLDLPMISVNVSARQCRDERFVELVRDTLARTGLAPNRLHLEITESVMFDEASSDPKELLEEVRRLGVHLSLDDFGTGYSSLGNLRRFPIDTLKIDRSFVRDLEHDPEARALVEAIIALANSLGLGLIAEGAENETQCQLLLALGCPLAQGYHLGRPTPGPAFRTFLAKRAADAVEPQQRTGTI